MFGISLSFCFSTKNSLNVVCFCSTFYKETTLEQFQTVHIVWSFSQWVYFCVEFHILQYPVNKDYFIFYFKKRAAAAVVGYQAVRAYMVQGRPQALQQF